MVDFVSVEEPLTTCRDEDENAPADAIQTSHSFEGVWIEGTVTDTSWAARDGAFEIDADLAIIANCIRRTSRCIAEEARRA